MVNISTFNIKLVKESCARYDVEKYINSPKDALKILTDVVDIGGNAEEVLFMIALSTKNKVIGLFEVSRGSINSSIVHPREVYKRALLCNATSIILAHNHPSGSTEPSKEDIGITQRLKEVGSLIGIPLIDHLIIGDNNSFISLKEKFIL